MTPEKLLEHLARMFMCEESDDGLVVKIRHNLTPTQLEFLRDLRLRANLLCAHRHREYLQTQLCLEWMAEFTADSYGGKYGDFNAHNWYEYEILPNLEEAVHHNRITLMGEMKRWLFEASDHIDLVDALVAETSYTNLGDLIMRANEKQMLGIWHAVADRASEVVEIYAKF